MTSLPCIYHCSSPSPFSIITSTRTIASGGASLPCSHEISASSSNHHFPDTPQVFHRKCGRGFSQTKHLRSLGVKATVLNTTGPAVPQSAPEFKFEKPVIVIDNYDSFTYNLCQYLGDLGCSYEVYRNDELTVQELREKEPCGVLISPGPGTPHDSGISMETVLKLGPTTPVFGVCMGLQCIGEAFGGKIVRSPFGVMHGKKSLIFYDELGDEGLLARLPNPFTAGRYHSLVIDRETFPHEELEITAWTEDGLVMGVRHCKHRHIQGVQFHPESIITENGMKIVENFLKLILKKSLASTHAAV